MPFFFFIEAPAAPVQQLTFDFTAGTLPMGATLTRASTGTFVDAGTGDITTAAVDVARFEDVDGTDECLLLESASTNLWLHSEDLSQHTAGSNTSVTAGEASPDGGTNADRLQFTITGGGTFLEQVFTLPSASTSYTLSFYAKEHNASTSFIAVNTSDFSPDVSPSGEIAYSTGSTYSRISDTRFVSTDVDGDVQYDSNSIISDHDVFGTQLEIGTTATSYIKTTSASASRAEDVLRINTPEGQFDLTVIMRTGTQVLLNVTSLDAFGIDLRASDFGKSLICIKDITATTAGTGTPVSGIEANNITMGPFLSQVNLSNPADTPPNLHSQSSGINTLVTNSSEAIVDDIGEQLGTE